jgi:hypothetical protein
VRRELRTVLAGNTAVVKLSPPASPAMVVEYSPRAHAVLVEIVSNGRRPETLARVQIEDGGEELQIFRRSVPYGTVKEHGLYFVAFSADRTRYDRSSHGCSVLPATASTIT